jgi:hypothetical protein
MKNGQAFTNRSQLLRIVADPNDKRVPEALCAQAGRSFWMLPDLQIENSSDLARHLLA